jgi:hypothetical protein
MKKTILIFTAMVGLAGAAGAAEVVQDWLIPGGGGAASGNTWLNGTNGGRGIDFISSTAAQNNKGEAVVVMTQGSGATDNIQILAADDGANLGSFTMTTTGDATLPHYRLATSNDGYIFVNGFEGSVQRYTPAGGAPLEVVANEIYATLTPAVPTSASRAMEVTGDVAAGTAKLFVAKGTTVTVFANTAGAPDTFGYVGQITTGYSVDVAVLGTHDGVNLYVGTATGIPLKKFTISYTPTFSYTADGDVSGYNIFAKQGIAFNSNHTLAVIGEAGGAEDGYGMAQVSPDGLTLSNIAPAAGLDADGDATYDAGTQVFNASSLVVDAAMDPATGEAYGYSAGTGATPTDGGVFNIRVDIPANVSDWAIY